MKDDRRLYLATLVPCLIAIAAGASGVFVSDRPSAAIHTVLVVTTLVSIIWCLIYVIRWKPRP